MTYKTAQSSSSDYLSNPLIQKEIEREEERRLAKHLANRERLIEEAHELYEECKEEKVYATALNAIDLKAKLNRIYDKETPDLANYQTLIQSLTVNVQDSKPNPLPVVVEPEYHVTTPHNQDGEDNNK